MALVGFKPQISSIFIDRLENKGLIVLANKAYILSLKMLYLSFVYIKNIKVCHDEMCTSRMNVQNNINIKKMFKKPTPLDIACDNKHYIVTCWFLGTITVPIQLYTVILTTINKWMLRK